MLPSVFKAKVDGRWKAYGSEANALLKEAYAAGFPSLRFAVEGKMYKFDFVRKQQKNLYTNEVVEMCPPLCLKAPASPFIKQLGPRPVFVICVPDHGPGNKIPVPHPKKLGKAMQVSIPKGATPGQMMFVTMPNMWKDRAAMTLGFAALSGGAGFASAVLISQEVCSGGGLAAIGGGAAATAGAVAPVLLGGLAVAGAVAGAAAAVHLASKHPFKTVATGILAVGGLAAVDHLADEGVLDAASDAVEGARHAADATMSAAADVVDFAEEAVDWLDDWADYSAGIVDSLF